MWLIVSLIFAVLFTGVINVLFVKVEVKTFTDLVVLILKMSPIIFVQLVAFRYYYNIGGKSIKFGLLVLIAMSSTIIFNFIIQFLYFKQNLNTHEIISIAILLFGIGYSVYTKNVI